MTEDAICPRCGHDLKRDELIVRDGFMFDPRGVAFYADKPLRLSRSELVILQTLAKADGRPVANDTLLDRMGSDGTPDNLKTLVCRVRKHLTDAEIPAPIETLRSLGYRWRVQ